MSQAPPERRAFISAIRTVGVYAALSALWIWFSDKLLLAMVSNAEAVGYLSIAKGWFFVAATSVILYLLIYRSLLKIHRAEERERRIADELQSAFLATGDLSAFPTLETAAFLEPALDEARVSGDFYDIFTLPDRRVALAVGDVSGKGLAAACRTAEVKYALRGLLWDDRDPASVMTKLNTYLYRAHPPNDQGDSLFVALGLVVIDLDARTATVCAAGAEPPLLVRPDRRCESVTAGGYPLGIADDAVYTEASAGFEPGCIVLMVTDGITEARNESRVFGFTGLTEAAGRLNDADSLESIGASLVQQALSLNNGYLRDDACLLAVRWSNTPPPAA